MALLYETPSYHSRMTYRHNSVQLSLQLSDKVHTCLTLGNRNGLCFLLIHSAVQKGAASALVSFNTWKILLAATIRHRSLALGLIVEDIAYIYTWVLLSSHATG
jgi:hypothetical protein